MAIKKIVIFNTTPFTKRDFIRFGGEIFSQNDLETWFYDFSPIVYPKLYQNCTFPDLYQPSNYFLCLNENKAMEAISELSRDSFVVMFPPFGHDTFKIFKALSKTNIPYCVVANQSFPIGEKQEIPFFSKIKNNFLSLKIKTLKKIIFRPLFANFLGIRRPNFCIAASELSLEQNKNRYLVGDNTKILWAHKLDYDIYLENKSKNSLITPGNTGIFLDPLAPMFEGDTLALDFKVTTTVEKYYPSICNFFDHVEKDVSIEIAAHPKSNHPPCPDYFGGRKTIRGDTFGMIKNSRFVMAHSSTALQFAILLKKPIIFITTNELEKDSDFSGEIKASAQSIGKTPINIDEPFTVDWEKELRIDEKYYDDYIDLYIKKRGSEELNTWQILANHLKCL